MRYRARVVRDSLTGLDTNVECFAAITFIHVTDDTHEMIIRTNMADNMEGLRRLLELATNATYGRARPYGHADSETSTTRHTAIWYPRILGHLFRHPRAAG